jgi:D-tyrosyl-tRNA(Tyr) deacylase
MRAVVQRVSEASVSVAGSVVGQIGMGLCVLVGVAEGDTDQDASWLCDKVLDLRIFQDEGGKMNRSLIDVQGGLLAISQFTLLGDARTGRRPAFTAAAKPELAQPLYARFCTLARERQINVAEGIFRATMKVSLVNEGPVTLLLDSKKLF